jgi:hypothetical protein
MTGMLGEVSGATLKQGVVWEITVKVPANPDVTKLERSGDAATHFESTVALVVKSAVNAFPLASHQSSILAIRPALHNHRPPTVAERKFCFRQVH